MTIENLNTGFSRTMFTNDQGVYQFLEIPPNTYCLTIKATGFTTVRIESIRLMVNTPAAVDEILKVQRGTTVIEVIDTSTLVNSQDASQGHAFDVTQIENLEKVLRGPSEHSSRTSASQSPTAITTVCPCCPYFPVFSSPTTTLEVVGNTGNMSSEKAGVGGSTPSLATIIPKALGRFRPLSSAQGSAQDRSLDRLRE